MTMFRVDAQAIATHGAETAALATQIEQCMTAMKQRLAALQGQWQGHGANSYTEMALRWNQQCAAVQSSLTQISAALHTTSSEYSQAESLATARFRG